MRHKGIDRVLALELFFIPSIRESLAAWGHKTHTGAFWNTGPGRKKPESAILDSIPLTLPQSLRGQAGLGTGPVSRQSSPQKEAASGLEAQAENSLRAAPNHERGMVPWPLFGLQEGKTQVWVQGQQQPLKEGGLGRS